MPIDNRELAPGDKLVATYKKAQHRCEVVQTDAGRQFKLADGRLFKSPSSAGKAITGRVSCDGWTFWSLEGAAPTVTNAKAETPAKAVKEPKADKPANEAKPSAPKRVKQISKLRIQKDAPEGQVHWFCSACGKGFFLPTGEQPSVCPQGHPAEVDDELAC
jgi:Restriction Enzyme Adenine Methylase Associated